MDVLRIISIMNDSIELLQGKEPHELNETSVYRLYALIALQKRFKNKSLFMHPSDVFKMSFDLRDVLTLKYCLMEKIRTPGLSDIFIKLDRYVHPAIQLEL